MQSKPVDRTQPPAYPTRSELWVDKGVLDTCLPRAWRVGKGIAGAVTVLVAANLSGCGGPSGPPEPEQLFRPPDPVVSEASDWVQSIFDDGSSRAFLGCVAIMPPSYFPEDEAMQVIQESGPDGQVQ